MQRASRNRIFSVVILCLAEMGLLYSAPHGTTGGRAIETLASVRPWHAMALQQGPRLLAAAGGGGGGAAAAAGGGAAAAAAAGEPTPANCAAPANEIVAENCLPGDTGWDVNLAGDADLQGFATEISVNRGESISFKVDTPASDYRLDIYRMGWYGGTGARKVATVQPSALLPQTQPPCVTESSTGLVDCGNWGVSASWTVPAAATSGIYFARLVREDEDVPVPSASHVFFVVRDDSGQSEMLFQTSDTTWQAYNSYGGNSFYVGNPDGRAYKVSYNRPMMSRNDGAGPRQSFVFNAEYPMVRWLERNGYDVSYTSGADSDRRGPEILEHKVFLSVGHDEYWSGQQRANVELARDSGVNLAFFSANEVFWRTRWEASIDGTNTPYRTLVSYKETHANAKIDPSPEWTGTWRDPRFAPPNPENSLTGTLFVVNGVESRSIMVSQPEGQMRFWRNTAAAALGPEDTLTLPSGVLGYEWDTVPNDAFTPAGLIKLSTSTYSVPALLQDHGSTYAPGVATHHLTLYRKGTALVFGAGTVQWSWGLDEDHDFFGTEASVDMQQATVNLFADMGVQPTTLDAGLVPATASTDTVPPASIITFPTDGWTVAASSQLVITGSATDASGSIVAVEVSTDGGTTWTRAEGTDSWSLPWHVPPSGGPFILKSRAVDDSVNIETPGPGNSVTITNEPNFTCPCSIWNLTTLPDDPDNFDTNQVEVGVKFRSHVSGYITGVRFYKGEANSGTHLGHLWSSNGTLLAEAQFTGETGSGWQRVTFPKPVAIAANTTYVASYHTTSGNYAVSRFYFGSTLVNPPLEALASGVEGGNGVFVYANAPGAFPINSFEHTNYWVDVEFVTNLTTNHAPAATGDAYSVSEDGSLTVPAPGVLANDVDVDPGTTLTAVLVGATTQGSIVLNPNGSFSYTPVPNFSGTDAFTYRTNDGQLTSNVATVTITVTPFNDPPVVNAGPDQTITLPAVATLAGSVTDDGPFTSVWGKISGPGTVTFGNPNAQATTATFSLAGSYELSLTASDGATVVSDTITVTVNPAPLPNAGVRFDGVNDYVTFGAAAGTAELGATTFTIETWFKKEGPGVAASTGTNGLTTAIPLVTKGAAQAEGSNLDANYVLAIDSTRRVIAADFEDTAGGGNHPVLGTTLIADGLWYHAAATYDGTTWRLYLNGQLETQLVVGSFTPRSDSIQHAGLATTLTSTGVAAGFFQGTLDEVRIWNVARSAADIQAAMGGPLTTPSANLIGRWPLDDGSGVTAADSSGRGNPGTLINGPTWVPGSPFVPTPPLIGNYAVKMGGASDSTTFGAAPGLGVTNFTVETWFRRDGTGVSTSTGTGGVEAIPLVTKGRAEGENSNVDMNYFLGIRLSDGMLVADFEEGPSAGGTPGLNHPIVGITPIAIAPASPTAADWHHAAVTYDGTTLRLYLDGIQENAIVVGRPPRADSIQHAGLGTAFNSTGVAAGFFAGVIDEARVWNYARTAGQIASGRTREITSATGLRGRWGFNEGVGLVRDTSGNNIHGTMAGSAWTWVPGAPFTGTANVAPTVDAGPDAAVTLPAAATLSGTFADDGVGGAPSVTWTKTSGPGTATFGNANAASTTVTFSQSGTYVLTLTGSDGELSASDTMTVTATGVSNQAPVVNAGPDQALTFPTATATLAGTASDDGIPSPLTTQWTKVSGPGTVTFGNAAAPATTATFSLLGTYVLQLTANDGALSVSDAVTITLDSNPPNKGVDFAGTNAFVTFGSAPGLGAATFTLETWFRRDGAGVATNTGSGGVVAIPLIAKGMAEAEGGTVDMNYFLGIRQSDNRLVADFEDAATGLNHPVAGTTVIPADGTWRHAAVTYDGTTWRLYLNGALEVQLVVGAFTPRANSIQHATIGTALNSTGGVGTQPQGFFDGVLDEARIWNHARSLQQIGFGSTHEIATAPGLLGRWGFNEGAGAVLGDSSGRGINGTIVGTGFAWAAGAPFSAVGNAAPVAVDDTATTPEDTAATIAVLANDTDANGDTLAVTAVTTPAHGTAALNANGTVTYTPAANYAGADSFTYTIGDGQGAAATATVSVTVTGGNDAPLAVNDAVTTAEDTAAVIPVLANDTDGDGDTLSITSVGVPAHGTAVANPGGTITYTPALNYNGADSFTYTISDGQIAATATVSVTITAVNDVPVAVNDAAATAEDTPVSIAVLANDTDADNHTLTVSGVGTPAHGAAAANANGTITYTPAVNFSGADTFSYTVSDGNGGTATASVNIDVTAVNEAPLVSNDAYTTGEDVTLSVDAPGILNNDVDADEDALMAITVTEPAQGALTLNADGSFVYTPAGNFNGVVSFTYMVTDGVLDSDVATVTITVTAANDEPVAANDTAATAEDTPVTIAVLANDSDVDGDTLAVTVATAPAHGVAAANANGSITYTPALNYNGADSFSYTVGDGHGGTATATVAVTVTAVNDAPVTVNDAAAAAEDTAATIAVLANDTDVDADTLSIATVSAPAHGVAVANPDKTITYTPALNYNGADSFSYTVGDGQGGTATATVSVTVSAVNDAPIAVNDTAATPEDTAATIAVLANDTDADGDMLSFAAVGVPAHGVAVANPDKTITYTPALNYSGADSFTYTVSDGNGGTATASVSVTINSANDAPVAVNDTATTAEDTAVGIMVLANDTDADGDTLSITAVSAAAHGVAVANPDKTITFTPALNYSGADSFTYTVGDGEGGSATATVSVTITAVNDGPVAVNDTAATAEDTAATIAVLANDTDADGDTLAITAVSAAAHGVVVANPDRTITYTPALNYSGADSFTYTVSDGQGGTATATVSVTVTSVNDVPVAVNDAATTAEDTATIIAVVANDTDADGDTLSIATVSVPAHGTAVANADRTITYTPALNYNGADSFTYTVSDGDGGSATATVSVTITAANDTPVANPDSYGASEDTPLTIAAPGVLANDTDADGSSTLTAIVVSQPANGTLSLNANGSFTYTPDADFNGTDSFTYKANDGTVDSNTATVTIAVGAANDAPAAVADSYGTTEDAPLTVAAPGVLANDTDADGNALTAILVSSTANGTLALSANGGFTYTPNANFNGSDSFTYKANDATLGSNTVTVTIAVSAVNDTPVAANDAATTPEDTAAIIAVVANDTDADGDSLSVTAVGAPTNGTAVANANGTITYTPAANYSGADSFTYTVSDGSGGSATATVSVTITAANDAPVAANDAATTAEDTAAIIAVLANDTDADGHSLSVTAVGAPTNGTAVANANGTITYTPAVNYNGAASFAYTVSDGNGGSATATVSVTITPVNDAPVVSAGADLSVTLPASASLAGSVADADGPSLTITWSQVSGPGTATFGNASAAVTTASFSAGGTYVLRLSATDGQVNVSDDVSVVVTGAASDMALRFDGVNDFVTFGQASGPAGLGVTTFTLETWFRRDGAGIATSTGTGGVVAVPLITKGMAQAEGNDLDMNYFLGIRGTDGVLVADFEDTATGLNHPVAGTTPIASGAWYHAAVTYDGTTWRLYLNGALETQLVVGSFTPEFNSLQHAAIGTALGSGGTVPSGQTAGAFAGAMDEVRIWSVARSAADIQASMGGPISGPAAGLLGRWSLNEASGTIAADTSGRGMNGTHVNGPVPVPGSGYTHVPAAPGAYGLRLTGTTAANDHVTFGAAPGLGASTFTLETWFRREAAGVAANTGTGGVDAIPLVTKGRGEAEGTNVDMNYFLGIRTSDGVLVADFEEGPGVSPGLNHPIAGTTAIQNNVWYHGAVTYDGTTLRLYLNGALESSLVVSRAPRADSIQHAALGTALNSTGVAQGFFAGTLDEARIWNVARSAAQILSGKDQEITGTATGLLGRWGLNTPGQALDSSGNNRTGTVVGSGSSFVTPGAPFGGGTANVGPVVNAGADQAVVLPATAALNGTATDDGLPAVLTTQWSKVSGPGTVTFGNAASLSTSAGFSAAGIYVLRLTANDSALSASDDITVTVTGAGNQAPIVNAGSDQTITLPANQVSLSGTATDDGLPGAGLTTQWTKVSGPGTVTFGNAAALSTTATFSAAGSYALQLSASDGQLSSTDTAVVTVDANPGDVSIDFGGTNAYVTFGNAAGLRATTFTLETWFRRDGAGIATNTGNGGVIAVPLMAKGMAETETAATDLNYFLGIRSSDNVLVADFEDTATSGNHPVAGTTVIPADGVWRHVAATYDGTTWRIFLNGVLEAQLVVGDFTPQSNSNAHATLATALNSTGTVTSGQTAGFFNGALDEARIWNYARSGQQIDRGSEFEITTASGLLGRWGMNETAGTSVADSSGNNITGTIVGTNYTRGAGAPFAGPANSAPVAVNDTAGTTRNTAVTIAVLANDVDADGDALAVTIATAPAHGTAVVNANGTVLFTPAAGYEGSDSFAYAINDHQGGIANASVSITIAGAGNVAPVVNAGPDQSVDFPATSASLSGSATDDGLPGTGVTTLWSKVSGPGSVTFGNAAALSTTATFSASGSYVLQLTASDGLLSSSDSVSVIVGANPANKGLDFGGTNAYVTFGPAPGLGVTTMTIETWFRRDGAGIATNTGSGGVVAVPLVTRGMAEAEGGNVDMNYFLGIRGTDNVLVADFEDAATGGNHPVVGTTVIPADGTWRHAAATYDGTTWRLFLNGVLEAELVVGNFTPQAASIQHAALGTALNSTGGVGTQAQGFFNGVMDEARVWNYARSAQQIGHGSQLEIVSAPGLRGRWGMNEGSGTVVADSSGNNVNGTLVGTNVAWVAGAPFAGSNAAPVAVDDTATTTEGNAVTVALIANDSDADGDLLAVTSVTVGGGAAHGTATLNANGTATYTPTGSFSGSDSFSYAISDGQGGTATATVSVTVTGVNDAPTAVNDSYSTERNTALVVDAPGVLGNDTDPDGDTLMAFVVTGTLHGDLTLNANGDFIYTPAPGYSGPDSFTYMADDGEASSAMATVNISVTAVNAAPVAVNDAASTSEDTPVSVAAPGLLGNDTDADGQALTAALVGAPAHGTVTLNANGSFIYTPAANYNGADSFTYKASDGTADSNVATVSITIAAVNDAPTAAADAFTTNEDAALVVSGPGVLANDNDVEGNALTAVFVGGPSHGTVALNANGSFTYTPAANYNGSDSFTYRAQDGGSPSAVATVTIAVAAMADPPVAVNDAYSTSEDTGLVLFGAGVLGNDSDVDGNPLTAVLVSGPAHGTLTLSGDGGFSYIPEANYSGPDGFTYRANDGAASSNVATVAIVVNSVNDAPVAAANTYSTNEDVALVVAVPGVLGNDFDADGNPMSVVVMSNPTHGTLAMDADGGFTYTPAANYNGVDTFTYKASDGIAQSSLVTVLLSITSINDAPVAVADSYATNEDIALVVGGPGLLANDSDPEGGALTAIKVTNPTRGTVTVNANGSFTYTPNANANGADSFTYRVSDGSANSAPVTVSINVNAVNDAPIANNQARSLNEDSTRAIVLTGSDVEGNPLTYTIVTPPTKGVLIGTAPNVTYDPNPDYNGPDSFTFRVNDGTVNSAVGSVTLTVTPVNDTPVGQTASYTTPRNTTRTGSVVATDVDGNTLTYSISTLPTKGTLTLNAATGAFSYKPNTNATGADFFRFRASDGVVSSAATRIDITILP